MTLYTVREDLTPEEVGILAVSGFAPGEIVWCHGTRPARLGLGPWGTFSKTYAHSGNMRSPTGREVPNMPMRYFKEMS